MRSHTTRKSKIRRGGGDGNEYKKPLDDFLKAMVEGDEAKMSELIENGTIDLTKEYAYTKLEGTILPNQKGTILAYALAYPLFSLSFELKNSPTYSTVDGMRKLYFFLKKKGARNVASYVDFYMLERYSLHYAYQRFSTLSLAIWIDYSRSKEGGFEDVVNDILKDFKKDFLLDNKTLDRLFIQINNIIKIKTGYHGLYGVNNATLKRVQHAIANKWEDKMRETAYSQRFYRNVLKNLPVALEKRTKARTERRKKHVLAELRDLPAMSEMGFPGGNVYRSALADWEAEQKKTNRKGNGLQATANAEE